MKVSRWHEYVERDRVPHRVRVVYGWKYPSNNPSEAYWNITGEIEHQKENSSWVVKHASKNYETYHFEISKHFPEFKFLLKWHFFNKKHYVINSIFWWDMVVHCYKPLMYFDFKPLEVFKRVSVYGVLQSDRMPNHNTSVKGWCLQRYPNLSDLMKADIQKVYP